MNAAQLQDAIVRRPFTRKGLENLSKRVKINIIKKDMFYTGEVLATGVNEFDIHVGQSCNPREAVIALAHELVHVYYKVASPDQKQRFSREYREVEGLIETTATSFLRKSENREYVRKLLSS